MPRRLTAVAAVLATLVAVSLGLLWWHPWSHPWSRFWSHPAAVGVASPSDSSGSNSAPAASDRQPTVLYAHNIRLLKGPDFRVYIRWIRGQMKRTHRLVNPSLDDQDSFVLEIQKGVIHVNIGDIGGFLNTNTAAGTPLKNISIEPDGNRLKIKGTVRKIVSLPVELVGTVSSTPEGLVRLEVSKIDVLKIPMKGLLGGFHIELADLVHTSDAPGITIKGNDVIFDTQRLLPPPHIHGQITSVAVKPPDLEIIYGNAPNDEARLAQWHNFLRLTGGSLDFGKLTMRNVDLTMIDASQDPWFTLDLVNYQAQLVNGYTRMTAQAGLEIFMPDVDEKQKNPGRDISVEWLKDRNRALPPDVPLK